MRLRPRNCPSGWRSRRVTAVGAVALGLTAALVSACSSSGSSSATTAASAAASNAAPSSSGSFSGSPWTVGVITDLTGATADQGQAEKVGLQYWLNTTNSQGGINGHEIQVQYCDSLSTPAGGSQCATQLANVNSHIVLLMGSLPSTQGAVTALKSDLGITIVPVLFPKSGTNIYQQAPAENFVVQPMVQQAKKAGISTIGIIYTSDAPGTAQTKAVKTEAAAAGITVVTEPMDPSATDVTPQLVKLKSQGVGLIFSATIGTATTSVLTSYHTLSMATPLVLGGQAVTNAFLKSISFPIPSHLYAVTPMAMGPGFSPAITSAWNAFASGIKSESGQPADSEGAGPYYAGCLVADVLKATNAGTLAQDQAFLAKNATSCLGSQIRYDTPGLNVATGMPTALIQAPANASDGWGGVTTPLSS
jgi:branched-chain amino acid transport system substrate-binding protein